MSTTLQAVKASKAVRITAIVSRIFLGLVFLVFGLNGFFNFLPAPPPEGAAGAFIGGLAQSGYFFPLLKGTEVVIGILLIGNLFVPLALVMLVPINLNIFLFHVFLGPQGWQMGALLLLLNLLLAWHYRTYYRTVLTNKAVV